MNNYNLAVQGWDLDEGVEHGPAEVGGRDDLNRCNNALNQMVVDLDSSVLDRDPAAAAVLRAPTSNDAGLNKPGLVLTGNGKKNSAIFQKYILYIFSLKDSWFISIRGRLTSTMWRSLLCRA